jgi:hypothetical protein
VLGFTAIKSHNYSPFAPNGFSGVADPAALIFFAYMGSTPSRRRARKPDDRSATSRSRSSAPW